MDALPPIKSLGQDLLRSTSWQRFMPLFMPWLYVSVFVASYNLGWFWLSGIALLMVFSASSTSTHDMVHGVLGFSKRSNEFFLLFLGAALMQSGHAYRATHLHHHRTFPSESDIEGEAAHMPMWKVLVSGPLFLPRLWLWAYKHEPSQRPWLALEATWPVVFLAFSVRLIDWAPGLVAYFVAVNLTSWIYPLLAVHLPHRHFEERREHHAWTLRGRLIPKLFLPLAYHLEHHLYPGVPSHNLPSLAERVRSHLAESGVQPIRVP